MRRILIFSLAYDPYFGGAEVAIKEKTDRMRDIEFHMVTLRYSRALPREEQIGNVLVHRIGFTRKNPTIADLKKFPLRFNKALFQVMAALKAITLHRKYSYDVLWAMMAHSSGVPAALFKMLYPRVPLVLELQEGDPPRQIEHTMRFFWPLFSRAFTHADYVSAISTFLGGWARRRGFKGPVVIIPNAVDTTLFSKKIPQQELDTLATHLGKKEGDIYLITTSRLVHKNAIDDVIVALGFLPSTIHFLILGIGPDEEKLKALAAKTGVTDRVSFVGQVPHHDLPKYLNISDIFIRPSRSEGMGNSFVEAMAAGIPIIATQEGGIVDFLFDANRNPDRKSTGFAVDPNSPQQIARAVKYIIENPAKVKEVILHARTLAFEKYDWNLVAHDMYENVFRPLFALGR